MYIALGLVKSFPLKLTLDGKLGLGQNENFQKVVSAFHVKSQGVGCVWCGMCVVYLTKNEHPKPKVFGIQISEKLKISAGNYSPPLHFLTSSPFFDQYFTKQSVALILLSCVST